MALLRRSGSRFTTNIWPGFVDAMTALLLVLMFVLSIFMIIQTVFREKISGQETELSILENEVLKLISNLNSQKEEYEILTNQNLVVNKRLKTQIEINKNKSIELENTLKNLDLAKIKISDFEIRMASLIARRTQLISEIEQKDNRIKNQVTRLEASRLALASARKEIDENVELARLAAAKREALELYIKEVTNNLNALTENKILLENKISERDIALGLAYDNLDQTIIDLDAQKKSNISLKKDLSMTTEKLKDSEKNILIEKLALKKLRKKLSESREELELATLSLEEERKRAIDNLNLIASSEKAMKILESKNFDLNKENVEIKSKVIGISDLLAVRELSLEKLRSQLLESEKQNKISLIKVKDLNKETLSLARQLDDLNIILKQYELRDENSKSQVENLGSKLNSALAQLVIEQKKNALLEEERIKKLEDQTEELRNYRSEFFGNLRSILGNYKGIEIVGDRFVFPSEILFDVGSDELQDNGKDKLSQMAIVIKQIVNKIPKDIDWILRVDGHTDKTKFITEAKFSDNWELSQARALSVVKYFVFKENLPAKRFAAAGFAEFQPIDTGDTEEALARNRRIEIKLTER